jgi:hypothetical protein
LHALTKGPGGVGNTGWATPNDLWRLKEDFAQQQSFRSLAWLTKASQVRVYTYTTDPACTNKTFQRNLQLLRTTMSKPNKLHAWQRWHTWYQQSFAITLHDTYTNNKTTLGNKMPYSLNKHKSDARQRQTQTMTNNNYEPDHSPCKRPSINLSQTTNRHTE